MDKYFIWKVAASLRSVPFPFYAYIKAKNMDIAGKIFEDYFHIHATSFQVMSENESYPIIS